MRVSNHPFVLLVQLITGAVYLLLEKLRLRSKHREKGWQFAKRRALTEDEFHNRFYADSDIRKELMCVSLRMLARTMAVPFGKLRPDDRFTEHLAPATLYDDTVEELFEGTDWLINDPDRVQFTAKSTVDDYVRQVAPKLYKKDGD